MEKTLRRTSRFILILLVIEFLDEFVGGVREAAWPLIRTDLGLTYTQIGLLISLPSIFGNTIEPFLGILSDMGKRRSIILWGGAAFTVSCFLAAGSQSFLPLFVAYTLFNPASGAFVGLSQSVLMDIQPRRHEQNMARWVLAGSIGVVAGPLLYSLAAAQGWGWRAAFWSVAGLALLCFASILPVYSRQEAQPAVPGQPPPASFRAGIRNALRAARRREVVRWLVLLELSETMLEYLFAFLSLYLVDVAGLEPAQAGLAIALYTGAELVSDFLLIPLLERLPGLVYLRYSVAIILVLYPAFLLVQGTAGKLALLALLGFCNAGWYPILKAQLYSSMPGQSGTALSLKNISGLIGGLIPLFIGGMAQQFGLGNAIWLLALGPVALLVGLPRRPALTGR